MIGAEVIADSVNEFKNRITSFVITFPRIVLAEFNTHRALSRNSASSRAIPFKKMAEQVEKNPFIPIAWQKDHSGMQGTEYVTDPEEIAELEYYWRQSAREAVANAEGLHEKGITKQLCNRMLEPFMYHTAIVTATEWENFYALRHHPDAEIHIAKLAEVMLEAQNNSTPTQLKAGQWHIPFGDRLELERMIETLEVAHLKPTDANLDNLRVRIATARCARVSYLNFEGKDDYLADVKLYLRLLEAGHMSPFEHCAQAMNGMEMSMYDLDGWSGNYNGFVQHRKMLDNENKTDNRLIKK